MSSIASPGPGHTVEPEAVVLARVRAALVEIPDSGPAGDVENDPRDWPAWTDGHVYEPVDPDYIPPNATPDATREQWLDALAAGQIPDPDPEPAFTTEMERRAAFRAALDDVFPPECERRGAWGGHPANEWELP